MPVKIPLAKALKIAKAHGYDGAEDFATVKTWFEANCVPDKGGQFEVTKTVTISVAADAGEDVVVSDATASAGSDGGGMEQEAGDATPKSVTRAKLDELAEKARLYDASKGIGHVNGVTAAMFAGSTAKNHERIAGRKHYDRLAAQGKTAFTDADEADAFGSWVRLQAYGWRPYTMKAYDEDVIRKAGVTTTFSSTGALIPPQFVNRLIDLRQSYGVIEKLLYNQPMTSDTASTPRRTGGLTVYSPGEGGAGTESNQTFDQVNLTARKRLTLTKISNESMEDAAFSMADQTAKEIAWSFAKDDDNRGINGDGSSTYAGDVGLRAYIKALNSTIDYIAGLKVGTGNLYSELTWPDFTNTMALLPEMEGATGAPVWLMHPEFYRGVAIPLIQAAGGATATERVDGVARNYCNGAEVVFSNQMPRAEGNSQVCALFGWFDMAGTYGRVRSMEIATSEHSDFANDLIAIRGRQRSAITIHDMGNADATEANRVRGPVVGLITAAS